MRILAPIFTGILLLNMTSCDLPHQPGPMPTEITATEFEPGLNIMGVLRADGRQGMSFININRALTTEEIYSDSIENFSPDVDFVKVSSLNAGMDYFFEQTGDSLDEGNYRENDFYAQAGDTYSLEIVAPGFPTLTAETTVPFQPGLIAHTLSVSPGNVTFRLGYHRSAFQYTIYLLFSESSEEKVIKPTNSSSIDVDWDFDVELGTPSILMIVAQDENLTRYGNSPISFIPNTYHPDGSTVTGGYGCFGSVAITSFHL